MYVCNTVSYANESFTLCTTYMIHHRGAILHVNQLLFIIYAVDLYFPASRIRGAGLSVERHIDAQAHMAGSEVIPAGRLLGLEHVPQECHHRVLHM